MILFDPVYFIFILPAIIMAFWAQARVKSAFHRGQQVPANLSGAAAARHILDEAGLRGVDIEMTHGTLSDHYDPRHKVLRLSREVYQGHNAAAVGIAAHEAGHALQDAQAYAPLVIRNAAVPAAQFGPMASMVLIIMGVLVSGLSVAFGQTMILLGIVCYGGIVFFQLVNLPVEFDASNRAKSLLSEMQIVNGEGAVAVRSVLNAAGWTYVAATLQSVLTLLYLIFRFTGGSRD